MVKVNAMSYAILMKLLLEGTRTCKELAQDTGLHVLTVYQYTRELHKLGVIHIATYEADSRGRDIVKVFMLGVTKDAVRMKDPATVRTARYRAKKKHLEEIRMTVCSSRANNDLPSNESINDVATDKHTANSDELCSPVPVT